MKILLVAFMCCVAFNGCGGGAANSNATTNTAANNVKNSAPTAGNSNSARAYPQETVDAFLKSCEGAGSDRTFCTCVFEKVQAKYTLEEFAAVEEQIQSGEPSKEFVEFSEKARAECEKQGDAKTDD